MSSATAAAMGPSAVIGLSSSSAAQSGSSQHQPQSFPFFPPPPPQGFPSYPMAFPNPYYMYPSGGPGSSSVTGQIPFAALPPAGTMAPADSESTAVHNLPPIPLPAGDRSQLPSQNSSSFHLAPFAFAQPFGDGMLANNSSSSSLGDRDRAMFGGMYYPYWPYPTPFPSKDSEKSASSDDIKDKPSSVSDLIAHTVESVKTQAGRIEEEVTKDTLATAADGALGEKSAAAATTTVAAAATTTVAATTVDEHRQLQQQGHKTSV